MYVNVQRSVISAVAVASALFVWFLASELRLTNHLILPHPFTVAETLGDLVRDGYRESPLSEHILVSVARAVTAFVAAAATGIPIGLLMGMFPVFNAVLDPFVQFLRPLPKLALIPLVIVWFGIGEFSKFLLIYLATFLTVVVSAAAAVMSVKQGRLRVAQALGLTRFQMFRHVIFPSVLPELFTGVRVGIGIGWTTLIAAEIIASSSGLGWMVMNASEYLRTDVVMLGIILLGITGYFIDLCLVLTQRLAVHWMGRD